MTAILVGEARLTDAALAELEDIALLRLSAADRAAGMRLDGRAALEVRDQAAKRYFVNLILEVRDRRAADLTAEDIETLKALSTAIIHLVHGRFSLKESSVYRSLLDKILTAHGVKLPYER